MFEEHDLNIPTALYDYDEILQVIVDSAGNVILDALKESPVKTQVINQYKFKIFY